MLCGFSFSIFCVVCHVQCWYHWQQHWLEFYMLHSYLIITFIAHLWLYSCSSFLRLLGFCRRLSKFCVEIILTIAAIGNFMFVCLFVFKLLTFVWYFVYILFSVFCVEIIDKRSNWQLHVALSTQPPPTHCSSWKKS